MIHSKPGFKVNPGHLLVLFQRVFMAKLLKTGSHLQRKHKHNHEHIKEAYALVRMAAT